MPDLNYYKDHLEELTMQGISPDEQVTVVVIPHIGTIRVSTSDSSMFHKFRRMLRDSDCEWKLMGISRSSNSNNPTTIVEACFETDSKLVSFRNAKITRELTDEQKRLNELIQKLGSVQAPEDDADVGKDFGDIADDVLWSVNKLHNIAQTRKKLAYILAEDTQDAVNERCEQSKGGVQK